MTLIQSVLLHFVIEGFAWDTQGLHGHFEVAFLQLKLLFDQTLFEAIDLLRQGDGGFCAGTAHELFQVIAHILPQQHVALGDVTQLAGQTDRSSLVIPIGYALMSLSFVVLHVAARLGEQRGTADFGAIPGDQYPPTIPWNVVAARRQTQGDAEEQPKPHPGLAAHCIADRLPRGRA